MSRPVAVGCGNARIAQGSGTAKTHVPRILTELGAGSRVRAAVYAYHQGRVACAGTRDDHGLGVLS